MDGLADFANLERDEGVALHLALALGVPKGVRIGETFPCLLHPDGSPSASLWRSWSRSHVLYKDWHAGKYGDEAWLSLAAVRARLAGRVGPLAVPELVVWKLLLAAEAGLVSPAPRQRPVSVEDGFRELLELRWQLSPGLPAPFSAPASPRPGAGSPSATPTTGSASSPSVACSASSDAIREGRVCGFPRRWCPWLSSLGSVPNLGTEQHLIHEFTKGATDVEYARTTRRSGLSGLVGFREGRYEHRGGVRSHRLWVHEER